MKIFKGVRKGVDKTIETLTKVFGVDAHMFIPESSNSSLHGFSDNDINYLEESEEVRVLIPALFRTQNKTLSTLDPFHDDGERLLYAPSYVSWARYSKYVLMYEGATHTFIINEVLEKRDDETGEVIFRKYVIVPDLTFNAADSDESLEGLAERLEDELEEHEFPEENHVDTALVPAQNDSKEPLFTIDPVKRAK